MTDAKQLASIYSIEEVKYHLTTIKLWIKENRTKQNPNPQQNQIKNLYPHEKDLWTHDQEQLVAVQSSRTWDYQTQGFQLLQTKTKNKRKS